MSDKIKPSEVSQVLLDQLKGISNAEKFDEVGTVLTVSDGVARIYGLRNAEANELLEFENVTMAIVMNLEEDNVGCVLLGGTSGIKEGMVVKRTKRIASIRVNDNMLGRVINPLGQAIDGKGDIDLSDAFEMPLDRKAPGVIYRQPVKEPLQTGLKAIDSMIPIGRGLQTCLQRLLHGLTVYHTRGLTIERHLESVVQINIALTVDSLSQRIDDATQHIVVHTDAGNALGALHDHTLLDA